MDGLNEAFSSATLAGIYGPTCPESLASSSKLLLYRAYTCVSAMLVLNLLLSVGLSLAKSAPIGDRHLVNAVALLVTALNGAVKGLNVLAKRTSIDGLRLMLSKRFCSRLERGLSRRRDDRLSRFALNGVALTVDLTLTAVSLCSLLSTTSQEQNSPSLASSKLNASSTHRYYTSLSVQHSLGCVLGCAWSASTDRLLCGFLVRIGAQFEQIASGLQSLPVAIGELRRSRRDGATDSFVEVSEAEAIKQSVRRHLHVIRMTEAFEACFGPSILAQVASSSFALYFAVFYRWTVNNFSLPQRILIGLFVSAMLVQLLLYCWFGSQLTHKSEKFSQDIFSVDWTALRASSRRELLIVMTNACSPIDVICGPFVTLSNKYYVDILNCSFSVFNLSRQFHRVCVVCLQCCFLQF